MDVPCNAYTAVVLTTALLQLRTGGETGSDFGSVLPWLQFLYPLRGGEGAVQFLRCHCRHPDLRHYSQVDVLRETCECVRVCVCACARARARARVCVCVCVHARAGAFYLEFTHFASF